MANSTTKAQKTTKQTSFLLVLLVLFANSGFAAAPLDHAHNEGAHQRSQLVEQSHAMNGHDHSTMHQHGQVDVMMEQGQDLQSHEGEDCLCDDVCCMSTANVLAYSAVTPSSINDNLSTTRPHLYQSIALDLLLPPPTL